MTAFGARLRAAMAERGPLCAGIDPHASLLRAWGLSDDVAGLETFALTAAEALAPVCAAVKPQSAFFERFGSRGIAVLEETIRICRSQGAQLVLDVKRGDIGSTAQGYADAYLDQSSPIAVDAITVSPFLGFGSVRPMIDTARAHGAGLFVLALTSNPEGAEVQHARTANGETVAGAVLRQLAEANAGESPLGSLGAVVGATIAPPEESLAINGPLLAPGVGAQGGDAESLKRVFGDALPNVLASSSREILSAGPDAGALRAAAERAAGELAALVGA